MHGIHFHQISSMNPDEEAYSVLQVEKEKTEHHICSHCLNALQIEDNEMGLNRALNKEQVEKLVEEEL